MSSDEERPPAAPPRPGEDGAARAAVPDWDADSDEFFGRRRGDSALLDSDSDGGGGGGGGDDDDDDDDDDGDGDDDADGCGG